ncbi:hypothetical protein E2H98_17205 [Permianibacter aggregans]|nr:hypothetical protein E2H98_17205 [Permianibacter aggregans]
MGTCLGLLFCVSVAQAAGQYIVSNARLTKVGNTSGNGPSFWVVAVDGVGQCITQSMQTNIYFPEQYAGNKEIFNRAYSTALAAIASGRRVNIYNYTDGACDKAVAIELIAE